MSIQEEDDWIEWPPEDPEQQQDFEILIPGLFDIFEIKKTQIEMMRDRGYIIPEEELQILGMTNEEFLDYQGQLIDIFSGRDYQYSEWFDAVKGYGKDLNEYSLSRLVLGNIYYKPADNGAEDLNRRCFLIYITPEDSSKKMVSNSIIGNILNMIDVSKDISSYRTAFEDLVIITTDPLSSKANEDLGKLRITKKWLFFDKELIFNVSRHFMVPEHVLLSKEKKIEFTKVFKAPQQISQIDPIVKYYGWDIGDIVMITRDIENMSMFVDKMMNKRKVVRDSAI